MPSKWFPLLVSFTCLIPISTALVCPIYLPRQRGASEHRLIKACQSDCAYTSVDPRQAVCLGVYYNHSGSIFIKQLGSIHGDEQCFRTKQCVLDMDSVSPQTFTCCCSTNNCTLNWTSIAPTTTTTYRPTIVSSTTAKRSPLGQPTRFSWHLFLIVLISIAAIILITFIFSLWRSLRTKDEKPTEKAACLESPASSTCTEEIFASAQQLVVGKNSTVYTALWDNDTVVLKVYQPASVLLWKNEVHLLRLINHDAIIKIFSEGQSSSHLYLLLPYYERGTLQSYLRAPQRTLSVSQCVRFVRSLASAVCYLHLGNNRTRMPIVHRDIKSSNVLVCKDESTLCLADFGVAAALPPVLTERDFVQIGTMRYMAPELLEGVIAYTHDALYSVDMYALALVMWEMLGHCDVYPMTAYQSPYEEYLISHSDGPSFAAQLFDIVVVRCLRPTFARQVNDKEHSQVVDKLCSWIDACWTADADTRMKAQTLAFKLEQLA